MGHILTWKAVFILDTYSVTAYWPHNSNKNSLCGMTKPRDHSYEPCYKSLWTVKCPLVNLSYSVCLIYKQRCNSVTDCLCASLILFWLRDLVAYGCNPEFTTLTPFTCSVFSPILSREIRLLWKSESFCLGSYQSWNTETYSISQRNSSSWPDWLWFPYMIAL